MTTDGKMAVRPADEARRKLIIRCLSYGAFGIALAAIGTQIEMPASLRRVLTTDSDEFVAALLLAFLLLMPRFFLGVRKHLSRMRRAIFLGSRVYLTVAPAVALGLSYLASAFLLVWRGPAEMPTSPQVHFLLIASGVLLGVVTTTAYLSVPTRRVPVTRGIATEPLTSKSDEPITVDEQDELGRIPFVESVADAIRALPFQEPFVFGLFGSWGTGKTSVLNLLRNRLAEDPGLLLVSFNPWYFSGSSAITRGFFSALSGAIEREYAIPNLRQGLKRYSRVLTAGARRFGIEYDFGEPSSPEDLRDDLQSLLDALDRRMVVLVDDIDRLTAEEVKAVLRIVGLCARIKKLCFVVAMDEQLVTDLIGLEALDSAYLEKIVQKPVQVPPPNQDLIDWYFLFSDPPGPKARRSALDRLLDSIEKTVLNPTDFGRQREEFDTNIVSFYHKTLRSQFQTIRQVKRFLNALAADLPPVANDVNLYDFVLLEVLKVFYPEVARDIWTDQHVYLSAWSSDPMVLLDPFAGPEGAKKRAERIEAKLQSFGNRGPIAPAILEALFPEVQHRQSANLGFEWGHDGIPVEYRKQRKMCHRDCFPRYFTMSAGDPDIADSTVHLLLDRWTASGPAAEDEVLKALSQYRSREKLGELFRKLILFRERIPETLSAPMLAALRRSSEMYRWLDFSEGSRAVSLFLSLVDAQKDEASQIRTMIESAIRESPALNFVVHLVLSCHKSQGGPWHHVFRAVKEEDLRKTARERLQEHYVVGHRDIIADLPDHEWGFVLYQWSTDWMTNESSTPGVVNTYVLSLIDDTPRHLGRVLARFMQDGSPSGAFFDYGRFSAVYDAAEFAKRLDTGFESYVVGESSERAARKFQTIFVESQTAKGDGGDENTK